MNLSQITGAVMKGVKNNSSILLSISAGIGTITTAYLTAKATAKSLEVLEEKHNCQLKDLPIRKEDVKLVWTNYIPPALSAVATIACVVGANRIDAKRTLAAQSAFAISQRAFSDYRDKVIEEYGERKDQTFRAAVAEDQVRANPPKGELLIAGPGNVLCCEQYTGRYFQSDMQTLKTAVNDLNERLLKHDYATLDDWYYILGLNYTSTSSRMGWGSEKLLVLEFSTVMTEDGRPCLAFEYNYIKPL